MNLKVEKWQEFMLGDLFEISLSSGDLKVDECDNGYIPLVSSGQDDNGIVAYISQAGDGKAQIFDKNKITVDMFCNAFYQYQEFYSVSHAQSARRYSHIHEYLPGLQFRLISMYCDSAS